MHQWVLGSGRKGSGSLSPRASGQLEGGCGAGTPGRGWACTGTRRASLTSSCPAPGPGHGAVPSSCGRAEIWHLPSAAGRAWSSCPPHPAWRHWSAGWGRSGRQGRRGLRGPIWTTCGACTGPVLSRQKLPPSSPPPQLLGPSLSPRLSPPTQVWTWQTAPVLAALRPWATLPGDSSLPFAVLDSQQVYTPRRTAHPPRVLASKP